MKCKDCSEYDVCHKQSDLRLKRKTCPKAKEAKTITNADRFRAMSDEDIAIWARKQIGCGFDYFPCGVVCDGKCDTYSDDECQAKIMKWLQQPVKED